MPRKKTTSQNEAAVTAPKRTRRSTSAKVAKSAVSSGIYGEGRPRVLSAEEKRQLILAHAAQREPVDNVQRFSLWMGVIVCVLAITVGWVYSMRQTIAGAITSQNQSAEESIDYDKIKDSLNTNIDKMVNEIDHIQDNQLLELQKQAVVMKSQMEAESSTSSAAATSSEETLNSRNDLFVPADINPVPPKDSSFDLPNGVTIDTDQ